VAETDRELLDRLRRDDASALETLMARYGDRVYRLAHSVTRNEADAEEVTQDVFLALFRKHETFEGRSALGSWIYRIAMNAALNRRRGRRTELETALDPFLPRFKADGHREGEDGWVLADWSRTPERELLSEERRAAVNRAIDNLPEHYRAVVVLRDVDGLTNEQVAEVMGESIALVKSRLHRARMALREQLTRLYSGTPA
jgi:RNA polymerase sigma-70 factor (ECF subfamily)